VDFVQVGDVVNSVTVNGALVRVRNEGLRTVNGGRGGSYS
jgi:hypothetical protein